jgi:hypothetical protein
MSIRPRTVKRRLGRPANGAACVDLAQPLPDPEETGE